MQLKLAKKVRSFQARGNNRKYSSGPERTQGHQSNRQFQPSCSVQRMLFYSKAIPQDQSSRKMGKRNKISGLFSFLRDWYRLRVPVLSSQAWFPLVLQLLYRQPWIFKPSPNLLNHAHLMEPHPLHKSLHLMVLNTFTQQNLSTDIAIIIITSWRKGTIGPGGGGGARM